MSTRSAALHKTKPLGLAAAAAMLLAMELAVVISWFPRATTETESGLVPGIPGAITASEVAAGN